LEIIQQITGEVEIRYYDMAHLKEKIRSLVISQDRNNIQMLTCFSLDNVLNGLTILLKDNFKHKFTTKTIVLDEKSAEIIEEKQGYDTAFATELLNEAKYKNCAILFEISIEGRGTIILDLF